ncbi:MAG: hypothetical protein HFH46_00120 [Bacilli bacterium]|nr:hypothetical protein [Bacilli bacterium]
MSSTRKMSDFINSENGRYIDACSIIMYFYHKSSNGVIAINDVVNKMHGNFGDNIIVVKRIFKGIGKGIYFNKVSLSYSDYLKIEKIVKDNRTYVFQLMPFIVSVGAIIIACYGFFFPNVNLCIKIILTGIVWVFIFYYFHTVTKF